MAPTGTKRVLVLLVTLLGTAHAAAGDACAADGSSAAYTETISTAQGVMKRTICLLYTSPSPRDQRGSRMPSSA